MFDLSFLVALYTVEGGYDIEFADTYVSKTGAIMVQEHGCGSRIISTSEVTMGGVTKKLVQVQRGVPLCGSVASLM